MKSKRINNLNSDDIDNIVRLLGRDLKQSISMLDVNNTEDREILAIKWDAYMTVLKQSTMPGCVDENNPYND